MGRPSKFNPELGRRIVAEVRKGSFVATIANQFDLHPNTIRHWVEVGLQGSATPEQAEFTRAFREADAAWESEQRALIDAAARPCTIETTKSVSTVDPEGNVTTQSTIERKKQLGDARAAMWLLGKKYPKRYGDKTAAELGTNEGLDLPSLQESAESRTEDIDDLLSDPPPELEQAILRNKDRLLKLLKD